MGSLMDPGLIGVLAALVAANSGLWRVVDRWICKRYTPLCGSTQCNKTVGKHLETKITGAIGKH